MNRINGTEIEAAINNERAYQDKKWGPNGVGETTRSVGNYILYTEDYLDEARQQIRDGHLWACLHTIRKVGALCVACLEIHGWQGDREHVFKAAWPYSLGYETREDLRDRPQDGLLLMRAVDVLVEQLKAIRRLQTRDAGDETSISALIPFTGHVLDTMRVFGAPLRGQ